MSLSLLPETMTNSYFFDVKGVGIYLYHSILNIYGGKICNNKGINNTEIYSNKNSTNNNSTNLYGLYQRCCGIAIFEDIYSKVNLYKGEISNNIAINNAKVSLITPNENKKTNISEIYNCIYGSAIYGGSSCDFEMFDDFIIQNNISNLNTYFNIEKNCLIKDRINSAIRGGQIYFKNSKVKFNGGIIQNSNNNRNITSNIAPDEKGEIKNIASKYNYRRGD